MTNEQGILLDVWTQFGYKCTSGGRPVRNDGGLSALEDTYWYLLNRSLINADGWTKEESDGQTEK